MGKYKKQQSHQEPPVSSPRQTVAPEVMDIRELALYLGLGKSKIYALIRMRKIPASRIGRQYRFSKSVVDQWLKETLITKDQGGQMSLSFEAGKEASQNSALKT